MYNTFPVSEQKEVSTKEIWEWRRIGFKSAMEYLDQIKVENPQSRHNNITVRKSLRTVATSLLKEESTTP